MNRSLSLLAVICGMLVFVAGIYLALPRSALNRGAFPPYSSLLPDPVGTRVLYESLDQVGGIRLRRHFRPYRELEAGQGSLLVLAGIPPWRDHWPSDIINGEDDTLSHYLRSGGTVLMAFAPLEPRPSALEEPNKDGPGEDADPGILMEADPEGLTSGRFNPFPWKSAAVLNLPEADWEILQRVREEPAMAMAPVANGQLIVVADSYFLSNEAMLQPPLDLLQWLFNDREEVIFDEWGKGVQDNRGILYLLNRHRLTGFLLSFTLVALVVFWHHRDPMEETGGAERQNAGRSGEMEALAKSLEKDVPGKQLMATARKLYDRDRRFLAQGPGRGRLVKEDRRHASIVEEYNYIVEKLESNRMKHGK